MCDSGAPKLLHNGAMYEFKVYGKVMKEAALSDISVDEISAQKIISNGQLFLIRDGKLFNALGQSINQ